MYFKWYGSVTTWSNLNLIWLQKIGYSEYSGYIEYMSSKTKHEKQTSECFGQRLALFISTTSFTSTTKFSFFFIFIFDIFTNWAWNSCKMPQNYWNETKWNEIKYSAWKIAKQIQIKVVLNGALLINKNQKMMLGNDCSLAFLPRSEYIAFIPLTRIIMKLIKAENIPMKFKSTSGNIHDGIFY